MAVNLVGMVMQYLTPDRIGRIAAAFNLDSKSAQSVAEVSVPSLLAGLASLALQPGGAQLHDHGGSGCGREAGNSEPGREGLDPLPHPRFDRAFPL